jgi:hypothetical protein
MHSSFVLGPISLRSYRGGRLGTLLGSALAAEQLPGAADIAKAYDTLDRSFLFRIMAAAGRPMVRWFQLLLSDTRAYTIVHGHVSKAQTWQAGVRQGCPLSLLLYLFVSEALACWLRQCPELGVLVANQRHVSLHHAYDTKVFLSSLQPELVQSLVVRLNTFALASGKRINIAKSCVVPLGTLPTEAARVGPLTVVASIKCLGVTFALATAQFFEPVGREGLRRQFRASQLWAPPGQS